MNRALRRMQTKEPKAGKSARASARPLVRAGTSRAASSQQSRGGILSWRPRFVTDIISELRKVVWPTRQDTTYLTIVVVIVTVILGALLGAIDIGFGWLIDHTLLK